MYPEFSLDLNKNLHRYQMQTQFAGIQNSENIPHICIIKLAALEVCFKLQGCNLKNI